MNWYNVLLFTALVVGTGSAIAFISYALGPKKKSINKYIPYECGVDSVGSPRERFSIKFYLIAILFVVFDIETVFLIPWAVVFKSLGWIGLVEILLFMAILGFGLIYIWKRGALEWD